MARENSALKSGENLQVCPGNQSSLAELVKGLVISKNSWIHLLTSELYLLLQH
jgi:hypothetical protein